MVKMKSFWLLLVILQLCLNNFGLCIANSEYLNEEYTRLRRLAEDLQTSLNTHLDPCDNFLDYVNGNLNRVPVLSDMEFNSKVLDEIYNASLRENNDLSSEEAKLKDFYLSCSQFLPRTYIDAIKDIYFKEKIMNFPIVNNKWTVHDLDWAEMEGRLQLYGISSFLSGVAIKTVNGDFRYSVAPGNFDLTKSNFWRTDMRDVLRHYGLDDYQISYRIREIEHFETYFQIQDDFINKTKMNIAEIMEEFPGFDWEKYFEVLTGYSVSPDYWNEVLVTDQEKISSFYNALTSIEIKETMATYYFLKLHAKLNDEYYSIRNNQRMCLIRTFNVFKEIFTNIVLHYIDYNDAVNFADTFLATQRLITQGDQDKMLKIQSKIDELREAYELVATKSNYKEYVEKSFKVIEINSNQYLFNYLNAWYEYNVRKARNEKKDYTSFLELYNFVYYRPRILLSAIFGLSLGTEFVKKLNDEIGIGEPQICKTIYKLQLPFITVFKIVEHLELLDYEKYQNEAQTLRNYNLSHKKLLLIILAQSVVKVPISSEQRFYLNMAFKSMEEFKSEYRCPPTYDPYYQTLSDCRL